MNVIPDVDDATPGQVIRAKWMLDGCTTLEEASEAAFAAAVRLRALHKSGWSLVGPIDDDYGTLVDPTGNAGLATDDDLDEANAGKQYPI